VKSGGREGGAVVALRYSIPFLFLALVPLGAALGGAWSFLIVALLPVALTVCDAGFGDEPSRAAAGEGGAYRLLPWLYIPLQIAVTAWAGFAIARGQFSMLEVIGVTASVGLTAGIFGFLAAHEMVHSPGRAERALGLALLASVLYMQFRVSHIYGHHRRAATPEDPATARRGESAYRFVLRSVGGQFLEAWRYEAARLRNSGRTAVSAGNRLFWYLAVEALVLFGAAALGTGALVFVLAESALAVFLLELFNYIAHYGLTRARLPGGGWERLAPQHSWNSSRRINNAALFNMGRHSDHHRLPARPYQSLQQLDGARELPCGYAGAILLALVPPLWRRVMHPRLTRSRDTGLTDPASAAA
jgi:alkane 1-monooxygenase